MKKKIILTVLGIFAVLILALGGITAYGIKDYIDRVPDITPYEGLSFPQNTELFPDDLAEITCKNSSTAVYTRILSAAWQDGKNDGLVLAEKGASLKVGEQTGVLKIWIQATGVEGREAEVTVRITE